MASGPTPPNHDFAPAWLKIPTNPQPRPSGATVSDCVNRRDRDDPNTSSSSSASSSFSFRQKSSSIDQRRDRGRLGFPYRQHSIDAEDLQLGSSSSSSSSGHEYRLSSGQRQHSGSQPSLGRRSLTRQDYRDGPSPSFSSTSTSGHKSYAFYDGSTESYRGGGGSQWHQGRQRSFERNHSASGGRIGANDLRSNSTLQSKESGHWKGDSVQKFDQEFPLLIGGVGAEDPASKAPVINGSVWGTVKTLTKTERKRNRGNGREGADTVKSGKIHMSTSVGKKLHLVQKPIRNESNVKRCSSPTGSGSTVSVVASSETSNAEIPKAISHASILKQAATKNGTTTSSSGNSVSKYRALMPAKGLNLVRRSSKDVNANGHSPSSKNFDCVSPTTPTSSSAEVPNTRLVIQPRVLTNKKSDFLKELKDDEGTGVSQFGAPFDQGDGIVVDHWDDGCFDDSDAINTKPENGKLVLESMFESPSTESSTIVNGVCDVQQDRNGCDGLASNKIHPVNGIKIEKSLEDADENLTFLSSSLEAEQRLLREMGWKEEGSEDEGEYAPLTEDEVKEMEHLSKVFQKRNGIQRNLQVTWSPKRVLPIPKNLDLANEDESISSSSSDTD